MNSGSIIAWYAVHGREFPWRYKIDEKPSTYHVWLSEIMLQQTTTTTVKPYFNKFTEQWPDIDSLSEASLDSVLKAWAGLGYYTRARNLHLCAQKIVQSYGSVFPETEQELLSLPGIGPYTAAAISAIAFDHPASPIDGNIARILARVFKLKSVKPQLLVEAKEVMQELVPKRHNGAFVQALMDIGATICKPRETLCAQCPINQSCRAHLDGQQADFPQKGIKKIIPIKYGYFYWIEDDAGRVCIQQRPQTGLFGGMYEIPSSSWQSEDEGSKKALTAAPVSFKGKEDGVIISHTFTHFHLKMKILRGRVARAGDKGLWVYPSELHHYAMPTLMKKVMRHCLSN